jgi:hypothetical protein
VLLLLESGFAVFSALDCVSLCAKPPLSVPSVQSVVKTLTDAHVDRIAKCKISAARGLHFFLVKEARFIAWEECVMDLLTVMLLVLIVLALSGWGYGYSSSYATGPPDIGPAPMYNAMGVLAVFLILALMIMYVSGIRLGVDIWPR